MTKPLTLVLLVLALLARPSLAEIDFNESIRPILNEKCTSCHGGVKQAGGVSFIYRSKALGQGKSGRATIRPGAPEDSEMVRRVLLAADDDDHMPPVDERHAPLTAEEKAEIMQWIEEGAPWGEHWAFQAPQASTTPKVSDPSWTRTPMDHWVLARLEQEGLTPSPQASAGQWLRRVSFGLTGLPPSPEAIAQLQATDSAAARQRTVEDLLQSPHFGERWAAVWMDLARYADSMGYESDDARTIWPYRDWLIRAFNEDMPYDEFTVRQLAGDLLPQRSLDDVVATAFHRNTQTNVEGGTDDEEFRTAALIDRVATTWTVWQGMTFGCVQCHSHPYEPFENKEFYEFAAFFNNTADCDLADDFPRIKVPSDRNLNDQALALSEEIASLSETIMAPFAQRQEATAWEPLKTSHLWANKSQFTLTETTQAEREIIVARGTPAQKSIYEIVGDPASRRVHAIRIQSFLAPGDSAHSPSAAFAVTEFELRLRKAGNHAPGQPFHKVKVGFVATDEPNGYFWTPKWGAFPNQFHRRWAVIIPEAPIALGAGERLAVVLHQNQGRDGAEPPVLRRFALDTTDSPTWQDLATRDAHQRQLHHRRQSVEKLQSIEGVRMPVLAGRQPYPRQMATFVRGNWLNKGDIVAPSTPRIMGPPPRSPSRLDLAQWIASPDNPLTARVMVNRVWFQLFGIGLVETLEDFGSTGTEPSHPALLDALAMRFQKDYQWSLKSLLREIVLSATYQQDARLSPERRQRDPRNRLLARGPRNRLSAEMVRDHALTIAGLRSPKQFGPPVMPQQPEGVWRIARSGQKWKTSEGPERYRRAIYTYWRRGAPYPSFETFDMPERKVCAARRITTNTPLQALVTLNDPVYVETSRALAQRMRSHAPDEVREQIRFGYLLACSRAPRKTDLDALTSLYDDLRRQFESEPPEAEGPEEDPAEAALRVVANTIFNLDAALTW